MVATIKVQETPQTPSFAAAGIQVPANIATPESAMNSVKEQQGQLNSVNNLTGGRRRKHTYRKGTPRIHKSFIRTYKGRQYITEQSQQMGGSSQGQPITIPQVGSTCSSGPQCAGAQNASFTAIKNQAESSSINDAYQKGGRRRRHKKVKFSASSSSSRKGSRRRPRHDHSLTSTIAYNIKKVMGKVFS
jgi:hypothetical protein